MTTLTTIKTINTEKNGEENWKRRGYLQGVKDDLLVTSYEENGPPRPTGSKLVDPELLTAAKHDRIQLRYETIDKAL